MVCVKPFRRRYEELRERGESVSAMARRFGCAERQGRYSPYTDVAALRRALGLKRWRGNGYSGYTQKVRYPTAERLCRALMMDPYEAGM